jgi:hypothetical protein
MTPLKRKIEGLNRSDMAFPPWPNPECGMNA